MAREYARGERVADCLKRELASVLQFQARDPRIGMVSITGVAVNRDLSHARVYCTVLGKEDGAAAAESLRALNRAAGFLRSRLARDSGMRSVPSLRFHFDGSVSCGARMEDLIRRAVAADGRADPGR